MSRLNNASSTNAAMMRKLDPSMFGGGNNNKPRASPVPKHLPLPTEQIVEMARKNGKAVHLVTLQQHGAHASNDDKLQFTEQARTLLETLQGTFAIIVVCGRARGGKSFLLNSVLMNLPPTETAFVVGSSVNACTRGLWIYDQPVLYTKPDGTKIQVLVIDTEGIGATSATKTNDTKIFSLGVLLASLLIYNSTGSIDENALDLLDTAANVSKHIKIAGSDVTEEGEDANTDDTDESRSELGKYFPDFLWVLRDFALALENDAGRPITENEYMENALRETHGGDADKNEIRRRVKQLFVRRQCTTLVRPVADESDLQKLGTKDVPVDRIRPEFLHGRVKVQKLVAKSLHVKKVMQKEVTGRLFSKLCEAYCDAINRPNAVPVIQNCWSLLLETHCRDVKDAALKLFQDLLSGKTLAQAAPDEHERQCLKIREQVIALYDAKIDSSEREQLACVKIRAQLNTEVDQRLKEVRASYETGLDEWMTQHLVQLETLLPTCKTIDALRTAWIQAHAILHQRLGLQPGHERSLVPLINTLLTRWRLKLGDERLINWMKRLCENQLQELTEKSETATQQLERITQLHANCDATHAEQRKQIERQQEEKQNIDVQLETFKQQLQQYQAQYDAAMIKSDLSLQELRQDLQLITGQAENVREELTRHLQSSTETLMEKERLLTTHQLDNEDLKHQLVQCQQEFDSCLSDLTAAREQVREIEEWERKVEDLQGLFETSQDKLQQSQQDHRTLQTHMDQIREAHQEMTQLMDTQEYQHQLERQQHMAQIEQLESSLEVQRKHSVQQLKHVQEQLQDAQRQISKCQEEKQAQESRHEREVLTLQTELQNSMKRLQQKEEEFNKNLTQARQECREEVQSKNQELHRLQKESLVAEMAASQEISKAKSEATRAMETLEDHKRRLENSEDLQRSKRLKVDNDRLQKETLYQQNNIQTLTKQKTDLHRDLQEANKRCRELETRNSAMISEHLLETMRLKLTSRTATGPTNNNNNSNSNLKDM